MVGGTMDGGKGLCWDDRGFGFCCYAAWRLFVRSDRLVAALFRALGLLAGVCDAGVCGSAPGEGNFIVTTRSRDVGFVRTLDSNNGAVIDSLLGHATEFLHRFTVSLAFPTPSTNVAQEDNRLAHTTYYSSAHTDSAVCCNAMSYPVPLPNTSVHTMRLFQVRC